MRHCTLVLATAAALTALSAASPLPAANEASKTPLTIKVAGEGQSVISGTFMLVGASAADADSGTIRFPFPLGKYGKTSDGLTFILNKWTSTLKGKRGTLVIRSVGRQFQVVKEDEYAFLGTWTITRGTGRYAGLKGGGGVAGVTETSARGGVDFSLRYEGIATKS